MVWSGSFRFGDAFAAYFGPADDNDLHQHAAYQITMGAGKDAVILDEHGSEHRGPCFLIQPLVLHAIRCDGPVSLVYLDPQAALAAELMDHIEPGEICPLSPEVLPFSTDASADDIINTLNCSVLPETSAMDERLKAAIVVLGQDPGAISIAEAAAHSAISESRLRALARKQFGVPLSTWLIWRKLETAAQALSAGCSLAEAALAGGFADQAHFTRAMRRMFGITPTVAALSLQQT